LAEQTEIPERADSKIHASRGWSAHTRGLKTTTTLIELEEGRKRGLTP